MNQQIKEHVGDAGVVGDDDQYDFDRVNFNKPTEPDPNAVKEVKIRVPAHIPNNVINNAFQVGMGTVQRISMDIMVIAFPSVGKGPNGEPVPTIGKFEMIIRDKSDVQKILELAKVINMANSKIAKAEHENPGMILSETIEGSRLKQEAARQSLAAAQGLQPIALATNAPRINRGGIKTGR